MPVWPTVVLCSWYVHLFEVFGFLLTCFQISIEIRYIWLVARHIEFEIHCNRDTLTYFATKSESFFAFWPHKLRQILQIWSMGARLYLISASVSYFCKTNQKFCNFRVCFGFFEVYGTLLPSINFKLGIYIRKEHDTSSLSFIALVIFWPTLEPKTGQIIFFFILWPQKWHTLYTLVLSFLFRLLNSTDFRHSWAILDPLVARNTGNGGSSGLHMFWDVDLKLGINIR